jgi:membrane dipeptidase
VGLENVSKVPNITRELVRREYEEEDIKKILGGNHLRVFGGVLK